MSPPIISSGGAFSSNFALMGSFNTRRDFFFEHGEAFLLPMVLHLLPMALLHINLPLGPAILICFSFFFVFRLVLTELPWILGRATS